jgi:hypothetical protein
VLVEEPGFHVLRGVGSESPIATVAVNPDPAESDLARFDPEELVAAVQPAGEAQAATERADLSPRERERRQALWWYLIVAALALLAVEAWVAARTARASLSIPRG